MEADCMAMSMLLDVLCFAQGVDGSRPRMCACEQGSPQWGAERSSRGLRTLDAFA